MNYYRTIFRLDFRPTLDFYGKVYSLAASIEGYPDWWTDRLSVTLQNFEAHCSLNLAHNSLVYSQDMKGDPAQDEARIRQALGLATKFLDKTEYKRFGYRRMYLRAVSMNFDSLVSLFADKFLAQNSQIKEGICPDPADVAYVVDFRDGPAEIKLRCGPVRRDELEVHLQPERHNNFAVRHRSLPGSELYEDCPDVGLLVDLDYARRELKQTELTDAYERALSFHGTLVENIDKYVFGLD